MSAWVRRAKVGAGTSLARIPSVPTSWPKFIFQVCLVSHHGQPTTHPCKRTNTDGVPVWCASPWMDWKTSLTAKVSGMEDRTVLAGFVHLDAHEADRRARKQLRPNCVDQMNGDVLGGGVERHSDNAGVEHPQSIEDGVVLPDQHAVVPVVLQPLTQERLDHPEIDHATKRVQAAGLAREMDDVSMSVQVAALAVMIADAVTAVDFVLARDLNRHNAS